MGVIKADVEHLRATIAALRQGSDAIESALQQTVQAMEALQSSPWSGQHRQQAEALWLRLQGQFVPTIETLKQLATRTERFTDALEEAGRVFGDGGAIRDGGAISTGQNGAQPSRPDNEPANQSIFDWFKFRGRWWPEFLEGGVNFWETFLAKDGGNNWSRALGYTASLATLGLNLAEKHAQGDLTTKVIFAEIAKAGIPNLLTILVPGAKEVLAVNAGVQIGGTLFSAGAEGLAYWVAGPEYDARIAENARIMDEALKKMDLLNPINQTIDALAQGKDGREVLNILWESTIDIGRGGYDYIRAGGDQLGIIASEGGERINETISEMGKIARTGLEQASQQAQQLFNNTLRQFRPLFSW